MDDAARYHRAKRCEKTWEKLSHYQCENCGSIWYDGLLLRVHDECSKDHLRSDRLLRFVAVTSNGTSNGI